MDENLRVAIIVPTRNRSDFLLRQLQYYKSVNSPHPVYIGDASDDGEQSTIIEFAKNNSIPKINYFPQPNTPIWNSCYDLLCHVKEKYSAYIGDDDFQIPEGLTECAKALETDKSLATAHGYAVTIKIKDNKVTGELASIKTYPQGEFAEPSATVRYSAFMKNYYVPLFSVNRTDQMKANWQHTYIKDTPIVSEILPSALSILDGKSKTIPLLSFIRQAHDRHFKVPNLINWLAAPAWAESYGQFENIIAQQLVKKDGISIEEAKTAAKEGMWNYLETQLARSHRFAFNKKKDKIGNQSQETSHAYMLKILQKFKRWRDRKTPYAMAQRPGNPIYDSFRKAKAIFENTSA